MAATKQTWEEEVLIDGLYKVVRQLQEKTQPCTFLYLIVSKKKRKKHSNMENEQCSCDLMAPVKSILRLRQWHQNRKVDKLRKRQELAVRNRRLAIDNAHMNSLVEKPPTRFWLGYSCDMTQPGQVCVSVRQNGSLPEVLQDDFETTIYLSVTASTQTKAICLVHRGKQLQPASVVFDDKVFCDTSNELKIRFDVYFVTGRFIKKKHPIAAWAETQARDKLHNEQKYSWRLIKKLSTQPRAICS